MVRIKIDPGVADDPAAHRWLDRILIKIEDGWHVWDTTDLRSPDEIETTSWGSDPGRQGASVRAMLVASTSRDAWTFAPHGRSLRVTNRPLTCDELTPEHACRLAEEPLYILVENQFSDGSFLDRVIIELDKTLHGLRQKPGTPVRIHGAGGKGEMPKEVQARATIGPYRRRLVVVLDSDRKTPTDGPSQDTQRVLETCRRLGVPCWILSKREAENYLPYTLLRARPKVGADHHRRVDAWDRLSDDQKDFFDMKCGLPDCLSEAEEELFDGLSPADRATLCNGFGPKVYECWVIWDVQTKHDLIKRGQGDLEVGRQLIRSEV